jgi:hypothetical protein
MQPLDYNNEVIPNFKAKPPCFDYLNFEQLLGDDWTNGNYLLTENFISSSFGCYFFISEAKAIEYYFGIYGLEHSFLHSPQYTVYNQSYAYNIQASQTDYVAKNGNLIFPPQRACEVQWYNVVTPNPDNSSLGNGGYEITTQQNTVRLIYTDWGYAVGIDQYVQFQSTNSQNLLIVTGFSLWQVRHTQNNSYFFENVLFRITIGNDVYSANAIPMRMDRPLDGSIDVLDGSYLVNALLYNFG